ncbi:MAG TPA: hypothetical protein VHS58_11915 [Acetobacteraceae bacterium]|jgi:hypothetical protein|nr:hypothetical protein [Acetobacteraceae bacterium]
MPAIAWYVMQAVITRTQGKESALAQRSAPTPMGKIAPVLYLAGGGLAFADTRMADVICSTCWLP